MLLMMVQTSELLRHRALVVVPERLKNIEAAYRPVVAAHDSPAHVDMCRVCACLRWSTAVPHIISSPCAWLLLVQGPRLPHLREDHHAGQQPVPRRVHGHLPAHLLHERRVQADHWLVLMIRCARTAVMPVVSSIMEPQPWFVIDGPPASHLLCGHSQRHCLTSILLPSPPPTRCSAGAQDQ